jgi:hypothetical protein
MAAATAAPLWASLGPYIIGQRTPAFIKQMIRIFSLVELEEFDLLAAEA